MAPLVSLLACVDPETGSGLRPSLDDGEGGSHTPVTGPTDTGDVPEAHGAPPRVLINEAESSNGSSYSYDGSFPDWVELYNASAEGVDLGRVALQDDGPLAWHGPKGKVLEPGGWALVACDESLDGGMHAPFALNAEGDRLTLSVDGYATDHLDLGALDRDVVWARFPDGGAWYPSEIPTPDATNGDTPPTGIDPLDDLFLLDDSILVDLVMSDAAINQISHGGSGDVTVGTNIDGVLYDPTSLRIRGSSTRTSWDSKPSLKVNLEGQRYRDLERFTFINMHWDSSYIREYVSYAIFRDVGVPSARATYMNLTANGEVKGYYLFLETYDDRFLRHWYGHDDGYLWEPGSGDLTKSAIPSWNCTEGQPCDNTVLYPLIEALDASPSEASFAELEKYVDYDNVLLMLAGENVIGQWDGYNALHNYRIWYDIHTGKIQLIPSSLDLTFDNYYDWAENYYYGSGKLLSFCLDVPSCADRYDAALLQIADSIETADWDGRVDELRAILDDDVGKDQSDPKSSFTYADYDSDAADSSPGIEYVRQYLLDLPGWIRDAVEDH